MEQNQGHAVNLEQISLKWDQINTLIRSVIGIGVFVAGGWLRMELLNHDNRNDIDNLKAQQVMMGQMHDDLIGMREELKFMNAQLVEIQKNVKELR